MQPMWAWDWQELVVHIVTSTPPILEINMSKIIQYAFILHLRHQGTSSCPGEYPLPSRPSRCAGKAP